MFLYLINYLNEFHALLKIFNPEIIICIIEMENDFSLIREHLLIPQHLNNYYKTHLNFTDNIVQLENFYIDYYSRYLYIIDQILTFVTL
jgi:hypothetical protein